MEDLLALQLQATEAIIQGEESIEEGITLICSMCQVEDPILLLMALRGLVDISIKLGRLKSTHERFLKDEPKI